MKIEVNRIQAELNSRVTLDEHNTVENLSLQMKIQNKLSSKSGNEKLADEETHEESISRLRAGVELLEVSGQELLH